MTLQLIDDQGQMWDGGSRQLRRAFDSPYSGGEFSDYAVTNLGFIAANIYGSSAQVRIRPAFATDRAIDSLYRWLLPRSFERIVLSWHGDGWHDELFRSKRDAVERLDQLIDEAKRERPPEYLVEQINPFRSTVSDRFRSIVDQWEVLKKPEARPKLLQLVESTLGSRYALIKPDTTKTKLVYHAFGGGLFTECDVWQSCAIGAPMEEMPDRPYGQWVARSYYASMRERRPRLEAVDAFVHWPYSGRCRMRYLRIILPIPDPVTGDMLLGGSLLDDRVDLRLARHQKS